MKILTEIQHYGGKTNLIDFTTDYYIALFFGCDGHYDEDGRVILQKIDEIRSMMAHPQNPRHRVIAQKSVFIRPPRGFIEPHEDEIVIIPSHLKQLMLEHLRNYHAIFTETIYNDLYGFIRNQDIHGDAYTEFYRGFVCQDRGDKAKTPEGKQQGYEAAITHYTKAIGLKPDLAAAYNNRGNTYQRKSNFDQAIQDYTQAIQLNPDYAKAHYNRGNAYREKGNFDQAIQDYTQAIQLNPGDVNAYINRGAVHSKEGDFENAITDYDTAIQLQPDLAEAYSNRGVVYMAKGDFDDAIKDYNKAIELKPDLAGAYCNRGEARLHLQEWDKAKSDLMTAQNMGTDIIDSFHNDYASVEDFEQKTGVQLPPDIAEMLTQ